MDLVNTVIEKKNWKTKIVNPLISAKWKREFLNQGADQCIIDKVFELLILSLDEKTYGSYGEEYKWILDIITSPEEIGLECNDCECIKCNEYPYYSDQSEDDMDSEELEAYRNIKNIKCSCDAVLNLERIKQSYLERFIVADDKLINTNLRKQFIKAVNIFTKNREKDYHPGSSETVIDILHPSLYCYVNGITQVHAYAQNNENLEKPSLFQWIPCNYSLLEKKFTSPIHGLNYADNPELHTTIETIFTNFLHGFQNVFTSLHKNQRTDDLISLNNFETLQVIVKISSTNLTPMNPISVAQNWHLEGIASENIIGTGIYYYDMNNITDSYLSFRTVVGDDVDYPQGHNDYVAAHYGLTSITDSDDTESAMPLGRIQTKKNMSLVFPNFLQHHVDSFELLDRTKEGQRNILVFFLIDPRKKIISTQDILNNEMSLEHAKIYRELLMFQRGFETKDQRNFFERGWSLCEH